MSKNNNLYDILIDIEIELRKAKRDLETLLRCRQGVLDRGLPESSDLFLDGININHSEIGRLKRKIFKFTLTNGTIF